MKTQTTPITESTELQNAPKRNHAESPSPRYWQAVLVGGVPGIMIGALGSSAVEEVIAKPTINEGGESAVAERSLEEMAEVQVAQSVTDDMSFNEAFAAARGEVGPGGAFVWHGHVYGTYRGDDPEWQEMSDEARAEHSQMILSQVHPASYTPTENEPEIVEVTEEAPSEGVDNSAETDIDIHIVGIVQGQTGDGSPVTAGYGAMDGHYAEFVDSDGDGEVDTVLIDANDNQILDDGEVVPVPGSGLTVENMAAEAQANAASASVDDALYGDMPDYTNDADASSFV